MNTDEEYYTKLRREGSPSWWIYGGKGCSCRPCKFYTHKRDEKNMFSSTINGVWHCGSKSCTMCGPLEPAKPFEKYIAPVNEFPIGSKWVGVNYGTPVTIAAVSKTLVVFAEADGREYSKPFADFRGAYKKPGFVVGKTYKFPTDSTAATYKVTRVNGDGSAMVVKTTIQNDYLLSETQLKLLTEI
jgi:hypothetical protein